MVFLAIWFHRHVEHKKMDNCSEKSLVQKICPYRTSLLERLLTFIWDPKYSCWNVRITIPFNIMLLKCCWHLALKSVCSTKKCLSQFCNYILFTTWQSMAWTTAIFRIIEKTRNWNTIFWYNLNGLECNEMRCLVAITKCKSTTLWCG